MTNNQLFLAMSELVQNVSKEFSIRVDVMEKSLRDEMKLIKEDLHAVNDELHEVKEELHVVKQELHEVKEELHVVKQELHEVKEDLYVLKEDICVLQEHMHNLDGRVHRIELNLETRIEPRLQNIEACYTSTFERYSINVEKFDRMQLDIDVIKSVVRKHEDILCPQPA